MPMTIHVTGFASKADVKLHTDVMSGVSAPFTNTNPAFSILKAEIAFVMMIPTPLMTVMRVPPTTRNPPTARTMSMMTLTSSWFFSTQEPTFVRTCSPTPMKSLTVGRSELPMLSVMLWMRCCSRSYLSGSVSLIAEAISIATPVPEPSASYIPTMFVWRSPILPYIRSIRSTASSVPNASASCCFSTASMVSPYLPRSWSMISGILLS